MTSPHPNTIFFPRLTAYLSKRTLTQNLNCIHQLVPKAQILPMIKANGYGHGAEWVAKTLLKTKNANTLHGFGVATLEEGKELRNAIGSSKKTKILIFSGTTPWTEEKGNFCKRFGLTPVLSSQNDFKKFISKKWDRKLSYHLKFDTGMNRLGCDLSEWDGIFKTLKNPSHHPLYPPCPPSGILTHLAVAENPNHPQSRSQKEKVKWLHQKTKSLEPKMLFHFANSSAIWKNREWNVQSLSDMVRPGIALYGVPPWETAPQKKLKPVMTLGAHVVKVQDLNSGETIGYGATYQVPKNSPRQRVAILHAGYADGVFRALSNEGIVSFGGQKKPIVGIVSMDLLAVRCTQKTRVGDWVEFFGNHIKIWEQAKKARTIPYELLTSVSTRVKRNYDQS